MTLITKTIPSSNNQFIKEVTEFALKHKELFSAPKLAPKFYESSGQIVPWEPLFPNDLASFLTEQNGLEQLGITQVRILTNDDLRHGWSIDIDLSTQFHRLNWVQGGKALLSSLPRPVLKEKGVYYVSK